MKIFSLRNLLGVGAIYAAAQYAKKNGGARNAFENLVTKAKELATQANAKKEELIGKSHEVASAPVSSGYDSGSYGGGYSTDFGGSGGRRS